VMRVLLGLTLFVVVTSAAALSSAQRSESGIGCRFPSVRVGPDQTLAVRVSYPPDQSGSTAPARLGVLADFNLFAADSLDSGDASGPTVNKFRFVEKRSAESSLLPGEAVSFRVGGDVFSGYSTSHLTLLGPAALALDQRGITVTGELTSRRTGGTLAILKPDCGKQG